MADALSQKLMREAAIWFERQDELSDAEFGDFLDWLELSPAHEAAFKRVQADSLDPALMAAVLAIESEDSALEQSRAGAPGWLRAFGRWQLVGGFVSAATLLLAVAVLAPRLDKTPVPSGGTQYATLDGITRALAMPDGSEVTLNAASAVTVAFDDDTRRIALRDGSAVFDVQADASRPFRVTAGPVTATALGTIYEVDRLADAVEVRVYEGRVFVERRQTEHWTVGAGEWIRVSNQSGASTGSMHNANGPAWLEGWMNADQTELRYVVERLNRYRASKISIGDVALGEETVSGRFSLTETDDTLEMIASLKNARISKTPEGVALYSSDLPE